MKTHHTCPRCKATKPVAEFYASFGKCRVCRSELSRAKYEADPEAFLCHQKRLRVKRIMQMPPKPKSPPSPRKRKPSRITRNTLYRDVLTGRIGRLIEITNGMATLRTEAGGHVTFPSANLRRVVSEASLANLRRRQVSRYSAEVVEAAARFGLSPRDYLDAMRDV